MLGAGVISRPDGSATAVVRSWPCGALFSQAVPAYRCGQADGGEVSIQILITLFGRQRGGYDRTVTGALSQARSWPARLTRRPEWCSGLVGRGGRDGSGIGETDVTS